MSLSAVSDRTADFSPKSFTTELIFQVLVFPLVTERRPIPRAPVALSFANEPPTTTPDLSGVTTIACTVRSAVGAQLVSFFVLADTAASRTRL